LDNAPLLYYKTRCKGDKTSEKPAKTQAFQYILVEINNPKVANMISSSVTFQPNVTEV